MKHKKILIVALADISRNPRPFKAYKMCIKSGFQVSVISYPLKNDLENCFECYELKDLQRYSLFRKILRLISYIFRIYSFLLKSNEIQQIREIIRDKHYDLVICHDLLALPAFFIDNKKFNVIFDAREYYPAQREDNKVWKYLHKPFRLWLCTQYIPLCRSAFTVCKGIANKYFELCGVEMAVVMSTPKYREFKPTNVSQKIKIIHHGVTNKNRKLENMIKVVAGLPPEKFTLDLMLVNTNSQYFDFLQKQCEQYKHINIISPVSMNEIIPFINKYDIGFYLLEGTTYNLKYSLPNKFFEYIHAGLMIIIGPSPEMCRILKAYNLGKSVSTFEIEAMINVFLELTPSFVYEYKYNSFQASKVLSWHNESKKLENIIDDILSPTSRRGG